MAKKDLSEDLQKLYFPSHKEPMLVDVPKMRFITVDGKGNPNTSKAYQEAIGALYSVAYTAKFTLKKSAKGKDFLVMPLESLWWVEGQKIFPGESKDEWSWKAMIMVPSHVTEDVVKDAIEQLKKKGKDKELPGLARLGLEEFEEGLSAQIMHIGPYSAERPTIEKLHKFIADNEHKLRGRHHEIYLGDPRRSKPEKLKTVVRQPCE
jgi:hypothetical protein